MTALVEERTEALLRLARALGATNYEEALSKLVEGGWVEVDGDRPGEGMPDMRVLTVTARGRRRADALIQSRSGYLAEARRRFDAAMRIPRS